MDLRSISFFRERKDAKKAFRGGVPPPRKLPLPRLGQAASRHRSSDASVGHLKCGVRYSLQCSAHKTPEPYWVRIRFLSAPRMGTACAVRTAATERRRFFDLQPSWHHIFLRHLYFICYCCVPIFRLLPPHISLSVSLLVYFPCVFHHPVLTV